MLNSTESYFDEMLQRMRDGLDAGLSYDDIVGTEHAIASEAGINLDELQEQWIKEAREKRAVEEVQYKQSFDYLLKHKDSAISQLIQANALNLKTCEPELGRGVHGIAFRTTANTVIKVTLDKREFLLAKFLARVPHKFNCNHLAKVYNTHKYSDKLYVIHLEYVETTGLCPETLSTYRGELSSNRDVFFSWEDYVCGDPLPSEVNPSKEALRFLNAIREVVLTLDDLGIELDISETRVDNIGITSDGRYVLFDQVPNVPYDDVQEWADELDDYYHELY